MTSQPERALAFGVRRCGEVDVHDAEALPVALGPLEVVEQRPHDEPAQVDAGGDGVVARPHVGVEVGPAVGVVHPAVVARHVQQRAPLSWTYSGGGS